MKKILIPAICTALVMVSCKKETKVEEAAVDNTAEVEEIAKNADVDSAQVAQYNKDEVEMIEKSEVESVGKNVEEVENNPGVTLKNSQGENLKLVFDEEKNGNKYVTYTKGKDAPKKVGLLTAHEGKNVYGDDKITIEVSESGGKAVFMGADKKKVEYK